MSADFLISMETPTATKCASSISFNYRTRGCQKSFTAQAHVGTAAIGCPVQHSSIALNVGEAGLSEHFSYFSGQALQAEGLLQKRIFGVTGEIKNLGRGAGRRQLLNQFAAADAGHDDVSDHQINVAIKTIR